MARKKAKNKVKLVRQPSVKVPDNWKCLTDEEFSLYMRYKEKEYVESLKHSYSNYVEDSDVNGENFIMGKHIKFTCDIIQLFLEDRLKSQNDPTQPAEVLMLSWPPQHGKSMGITETLPSWYVGFNPTNRAIVVSYGDDLARRFGRRNKQKLKDNEQVLFQEFDLVRDSDTDIFTSENGSILSRGIGAGVTGQSADLIIVDDPIKNREEAESQKIRDKIFNEYRDSLLSRLSANGKIIVIMTRWHEDDLIGRIEKLGLQDYFYLNLPCEAEEGDLIGRAVGEPLFPEIGKDKKWLEKKKRAHGDTEGKRSWDSLYQGRPTAQEGNMFKRHYWKYYDPLLDMPKYFDEVMQSWDCAFKDEESSDYVCGTVWGRQGGYYYLLDLINERMDIINTMKAIENMSQKWPKSLIKLVEDKANGPAVIRLLRNKVPGLIAITPDGGKVARANAILGAVESGNVFIPIPELCPWVLDYIEQHASFPQGTHDRPTLSCLNSVNCWKPLRAS
jgi:predicted phage terminase large subunit-like protein